jgi:hypothetical protein
MQAAGLAAAKARGQKLGNADLAAGNKAAAAERADALRAVFSIPPILAAAVREAPSRTAAIASSRRAGNAPVKGVQRTGRPRGRPISPPSSTHQCAFATPS